MEQQEPLAVYRERMVQVQRVFALYPDRVVVRARWLLRGTHEMAIRLATLKSEPRQIIIRNRWFKHALLVVAIGVAVALLCGKADASRAYRLASAVGWGVAAAGTAVAFMSYRKIVFARFDALSGRGGLDIAFAGSRREDFETFVRAVGKQIRKSQR